MCLKTRKKYGRQPYSNPPPPASEPVTPDTCIKQDTNGSADLNAARHGQFQEKEKKRRLLN